MKFILLILFLAIITELVQLWIPARKFNVFDLLSNVAGLVWEWALYEQHKDKDEKELVRLYSYSSKVSSLSHKSHSSD